MEKPINYVAPEGRTAHPDTGDVLARRSLRGIQWLASHAGRMEMAAWDDAALRLLADVAGAEAALLYWVEPPRPGAATGLSRQHGLVPADYQPLAAVPSRVRSLAVKAASRYVAPFAGAEAAGVVLVPVQTGGRLLGAIHLYCRGVRRLGEVQSNTLALLGQLVGYVHRHCLEGVASVQGDLSAAGEPVPVAPEPAGLFREQHFHRMLQAELDRASRYGDPLGLILLTLGDTDAAPGAGSRDLQRLLNAWSAVLPALSRRMDYAFVLEPGTFAVLLPRSPEEGLRQRAAELQNAFVQLLAESFPAMEGLRLRMGGAVYESGDAVSDMLQQAAAGLARAVGQHSESLVILQRTASDRNG